MTITVELFSLLTNIFIKLSYYIITFHIDTHNQCFKFQATCRRVEHLDIDTGNNVVFPQCRHVEEMPFFLNL